MNEIDKLKEENNELKGRLSAITQQLEWSVEELKRLNLDSEKCIIKYGWNRKDVRNG